MNQMEIRQLDSLIGTRRFLDANARSFSGLSASMSRQRLDEIITQVQVSATTQATHERLSLGLTTARAQLERELRRGHVLPIVEFARARMTGLGEGEFKALTQATGKLKGARLVQAALAIAQVAAAHVDQLVAGHFPGDVVTQLVAAADAVQASLHDRAELAAEGTGATQRIAQGLAEGRAIVRMIGAVVKRTARNDPGLLAEWRSAQRVKQKPVIPARQHEVAGAIASAVQGSAREVAAAA